MDEKAAFLCRTMHIHHSAQSDLNIQQLDHEEKHFYWIQTQEPGQRGHYIWKLQLQYPIFGHLGQHKESFGILLT